jgi:hypothetical protein
VGRNRRPVCAEIVIGSVARITVVRAQVEQGAVGSKPWVKPRRYHRTGSQDARGGRGLVRCSVTTGDSTFALPEPWREVMTARSEGARATT